MPFPADALEIVRHAAGRHFEEVVLFGRNYRVEDALRPRPVDEIVPADGLMATASEARRAAWPASRRTSTA